jgi:hypothetical protein
MPSRHIERSSPTAARGSAERRAARARLGHPHRGAQRLRLRLDLLEIAREVPGEIVKRAASGRHVHEPEQRRAQLGVLARQLHRLRVERAHRVPRARREARRELASNLPKVALVRSAELQD